MYEGGWRRLISCGEDDARRDYDTSVDVLTTLFTYLEIGVPRYLKVLSVSAQLKFAVRFFKTKVEELTRLSP